MTATSAATAMTRRERLSALPSWLGGLVGTVALVLLWWLTSAVLFQASHSVPNPGAVFSLFFSADEWRNTLANGTGTLTSAALGYVYGNLAALALAVLVLLLPPLEQVATQIAIVTYCMPLVAIGPILVIVAGRDAPQGASIALAALSVFFTSVVGALLGLRAAPRSSLDLVRAYGGTRWTGLRLVQLIAALPDLFGALKIAAPAAFLGAVLAEYLGSGGDASIGRALIAAQSNGDGVRLWYLALVCGAVAGAAYVVLGQLGRVVAPWSAAQRGSRP